MKLARIQALYLKSNFKKEALKNEKSKKGDIECQIAFYKNPKNFRKVKNSKSRLFYLLIKSRKIF